MQHVLVVCHPKRRSFVQLLARTYATELQSLGHSVTVRDLYRQGFDPVLGEGELGMAEEPVVPAVVRREQRHLAAAGGVAFFYPIWWGYMPAMMKGYVDRVLSAGFAYDFEEEEIVPRLTGKSAMIFTSSGADMAYLRRSKQWNAMRMLQDQIVSECGIELLEHVHFASIVPDLEKRTIDRHLARVRTAVQKHWGGAPVPQG